VDRSAGVCDKARWCSYGHLRVDMHCMGAAMCKCVCADSSHRYGPNYPWLARCAASSLLYIRAAL
jgi:hypothetical protein